MIDEFGAVLEKTSRARLIFISSTFIFPGCGESVFLVLFVCFFFSCRAALV